MRRRLITIIVLVLFMTTLFVYPNLSSIAAFTDAFRQGPRQSRRAGPVKAGRSAIDYSSFSHRSRGHRQACDSCHTVPTANWPKARGYPDVADYPDHNACVSCHRQQFFKGARPAICTICHTKVSPRDDARFPFRKPGSPRQFTDSFPHDKHQDVIAQNGPSSETFRGLSFIPASFNMPGNQTNDKSKRFNNCSICHETSDRRPQPPPGGWPDNFAPEASFFKTAPASHASCFNCHWQGQQPTRDDCAGCHKAAAPYLPQEWPHRISLKFTHEREQHIAECTVCHINITKASTLRGLKPDVPISSCGPCHKTSTSKETVTLEVEMSRRAKDASYACTKCHTSDIGRRSVPASHNILLLQ